MKIFSSHRRKLKPSRRFGGREFQNKIKLAQNYKRVFGGGLSESLKKWRHLGIGIFVIIFYFLAISSHFVISEIKVLGNQGVSSQQIHDAIAQAGQSRIFLIKKNNYFLLTRGRANKILTQALPNIKEVSEYNRTWPNKVEITIKERIPGFVIQSNGKNFLVDDQGMVVSEISDAKNLLIVQDQVVEDFASGESLPNAKLAPFVLSMARQWPSRVSAPISLVKFPGKGSNDVQFEVAEGWSVFFDTNNRSVVAQLNDLAVILNKQIPAKDRTRLAYIDLRLTKWAYICYKATACQQQPQTAENTNAQ